MRKVSLIGLVSVLTVFLGGCPVGDNTQEATAPTPAPVASPPVRPKPSPTAAPFSNPVTPRQPGKSPAVAGLIQSLPAGARKIPQGRSDPFAVVPVQPQVTVSPNEGAGDTTAVRPVPVIPPLPPQRANGGTGGNAGATGNRPAPRRNVLPPRRPVSRLSRGATAAKPRPTSPANRGATAAKPRPTSPANRGAIAAKPRPTSLPTPSAGLTPPRFIPQLPPLPDPTLAKSVAVTGVIDVGGVPNAIVQVPNEPSRYVREGQRISNGQVLVKRIEVNRGPTPVVILEQFGVEVARQVGDQPAGSPEQGGSPTASLPPPPPVNDNLPPS